MPSIEKQFFALFISRVGIIASSIIRRNSVYYYLLFLHIASARCFFFCFGLDVHVLESTLLT